MSPVYDEDVLPLCLEQEPFFDEFAISLLCLITLWILEVTVRGILSCFKLKPGTQIEDPEDYEPNLHKEEVVKCLFGCFIRAFVCCVLVYKFNEFSLLFGWEIRSCANVRVLIVLLSFLLLYELLRLPPIGWVKWLRDLLFLLFYISYYSGLPGTISSYYYGIVFIVTFAESCRCFVQFLLFLSQIMCLCKSWRFIIIAMQFSISIIFGVLAWFCWVQWLPKFKENYVKWLIPVSLLFLTGLEFWCSYLMVMRFASRRRSEVLDKSPLVGGQKILSIRQNQQITINPKHFHKSFTLDKSYKSCMNPAMSESNISGSTKLFSLEEVLMSNRGSRISKSWNSDNQEVTSENRDVLPCLYPGSEDDSVMSTPITAKDKIRRHYSRKSTNSTPIKWPQPSSSGVSKSKHKLGYPHNTGINSLNKGRHGGLLSSSTSSKVDGFTLDQGKRPSYFLIKGSGSNLLPGRLVPTKGMPVTPELSTSHYHKAPERFLPPPSQNTSQQARIGSIDYSEDPATLATGDEDFEGLSDDFNFNVLFPFGENVVAPTESNATNHIGVRSTSSPSLLDFSSEVEGYNAKTNSGKRKPKRDMVELAPPGNRYGGRKTPNESEKSRFASDDSVLCAFNTKLPKQLQKTRSAELILGKRDINDITSSTHSEFRSSINRSTSDFGVDRVSKMNSRPHSEKTASSKSLVAMEVQNFDSASSDRSSGWGHVIRIDSSIEFEQKLLNSPVKRRATLTPTTGSL